MNMRYLNGLYFGIISMLGCSPNGFKWGLTQMPCCVILTQDGVNGINKLCQIRGENAMKAENMRFGEFIKSKRLADDRDLTLKDVAKALGISVSMLSDIEQGRRKPFDQEKLERFCDFLGVGDEERALLYDLSAKETRKIPDDIEDTMMYTTSGAYARRALRLTNSGIIGEEDWKRFIREKMKEEQE